VLKCLTFHGKLLSQCLNKDALFYDLSRMVLGLVSFRVKNCKVVTAQVVEHPRVFQVVTFREDTRVSVGRNDFANKNRVVPGRELAVNGAFKVSDAFADSRRFDFFAGNRR
jgi:hypothetical protein